MKWIFHARKGFISTRLKKINRQLELVERDIRELNRFIARPRLRKSKEEPAMVANRLGQVVLPESQKRFVSYLSTGSFQTIGLRKHEQRMAKMKAILTVVAIALIAFLFIYSFFRSLY